MEDVVFSLQQAKDSNKRMKLLHDSTPTASSSTTTASASMAEAFTSSPTTSSSTEIINFQEAMEFVTDDRAEREKSGQVYDWVICFKTGIALKKFYYKSKGLLRNNYLK